jgi:hypothetical protein
VAGPTAGKLKRLVCERSARTVAVGAMALRGRW